MSLYLRDATGQTLEDVRKAVSVKTTTTTSSPETFELSLTGDDGAIFSFDSKRGKKHEVPLTNQGLEVLCEFLKVPYKFIERQDAQFRELILRELIRRERIGELVVKHANQGLVGFYGVSQIPFEPHHVAEVAQRVMGAEAEVYRWWVDAKEFRLELVAAEGTAQAKLGDSKVGDLTAAGVQLGLNIAKNHSPFVRPFQRRLICTNGMTGDDFGLTLDARGKSLEQVLDDLERATSIAYDRAQGEITAFYDLRNVPVDNPERTVARIAREQRLSDRQLASLVERVPAEIPEGEDPSMFHILNLFTNEANNPEVKDGVADKLMAAAGTIVTEHAARCGHCQAKLN